MNIFMSPVHVCHILQDLEQRPMTHILEVGGGRNSDGNMYMEFTWLKHFIQIL